MPVAGLIKVQSVKDGKLLELWVRFAMQASLKEFAVHWSFQTQCERQHSEVEYVGPTDVDTAGYC